MRLWHKDLIPVLPRQQLLGQWRECCAIMANIQTKGTPNHILVNKVMDYEAEEFMTYIDLVSNEMTKRGYRCNKTKFDKYREELTLCCNWFLHPSVLFEGWHNDRYLTQCYYNLQEKYDCGGITEDEWQKIDARYKELMNYVN